MKSTPRKLGIGVIGCGHWGPNHVRVFSESDRAQVIACADTNPTRLQRLAKRFPSIRTYTDHQKVLTDPQIDAVVIATPTNTHAALAMEALSAGKHVLVEKPMCRSTEEAQKLMDLSVATGKVLMVGHVFLFNDGIRALRETITSGQLGRILYLDAVRTNLGPVRGDVNALFDLGTHDIAILNYLLGSVPVEVSATGRCISQASVEDVCFATLRYADGTLGHIHVSWMNPRKVRTLTVIGERKMAHWDDIDPVDTLRLHDKGFDEPPYYDSYGEFHYVLRNADVHLPAIRRTEPLVNQAEAFLDAVLNNARRVPLASDGADVVRVLEAAMRSLRGGGAFCAVESEITTSCKIATLPKRAVLVNHDSMSTSAGGQVSHGQPLNDAYPLNLDC